MSHKRKPDDGKREDSKKNQSEEKFLEKHEGSQLIKGLSGPGCNCEQGWVYRFSEMQARHPYANFTCSFPDLWSGGRSHSSAAKSFTYRVTSSQGGQFHRDSHAYERIKIKIDDNCFLVINGVHNEGHKPVLYIGHEEPNPLIFVHDKVYEMHLEDQNGQRWYTDANVLWPDEKNSYVVPLQLGDQAASLIVQGFFNFNAIRLGDKSCCTADSVNRHLQQFESQAVEIFNRETKDNFPFGIQHFIHPTSAADLSKNNYEAYFNALQSWFTKIIIKFDDLKINRQEYNKAIEKLNHVPNQPSFNFMKEVALFAYRLQVVQQGRSRSSHLNRDDTIKRLWALFPAAEQCFNEMYKGLFEQGMDWMRQNTQPSPMFKLIQEDLKTLMLDIQMIEKNKNSSDYRQLFLGYRERMMALKLRLQNAPYHSSFAPS